MEDDLLKRLGDAYGNNYYKILYLNQATFNSMFNSLRETINLPLDTPKVMRFNSADVRVDDRLADGEFRFSEG